MNSRHDSPHLRKSQTPRRLNSSQTSVESIVAKFRSLAIVVISALLAPLMVGAIAAPASATTAPTSTISGSSTFNVAFYEGRTWDGLLASGGTAITNATLHVTRHTPGAPEETSAVTTDQHGAFSVAVAQWSSVDGSPADPGSIEIEWSGNDTISGSTFTVDLRIDPIDAVGMTVTHDAGDLGTADNPLPLGTEVTYDIYVAAARAGGQQHVTVEYSDPTALYRIKTEDVALTNGHAQVILPMVLPGTAPLDNQGGGNYHSIRYSYLSGIDGELEANFLSGLHGGKFTRGLIFDWEAEEYDAPVDGVIYQQRGDNYPWTLMPKVGALEFPEYSRQAHESVVVRWAWATEDELDRALADDLGGVPSERAGMMNAFGSPPSVFMGVPKVTGAEPLYLVATASASDNAISWIADMEPRVVLKIARDPSPIVPNFSLNMDSTTLKAGENVVFLTRLRDSDLKSPIRGTVSIHAEGPWGDRIIAQSATSSTMSGDNSTEQALHGTVPLGTTRIHAEFEPADDFPWSAATQTSPTRVTVSSTEAVLDDVDPIRLSLLSETTVELKLDQPLTTTASYQLHGVTAEYGAPITGPVEFINGNATLTIPRATAPFQVPKSVVISPAPDTGVAFDPRTIEISPLPAKPLALDGPETAVAGAPTEFTATYAKTPQDNEENLAFEIFMGTGSALRVLGSAPAHNGLATISAALPAGTLQVGLRLVRGGEVLHELPNALSTVVSKQETSVGVPSSFGLSHSASTSFTGIIRTENGVATSGTVKYQLTGLVVKHEGTVPVGEDGQFTITLPQSFDRRSASLGLFYIGTDTYSGSASTVSVKPSAALTAANVTLSRTTSAYAGQGLKLTAKVTDSAKRAVTGGKVTFYQIVNGKRISIGTSTVKNGAASKTVTPASGTQSFVAVFSGFGTSAIAESSISKVNVAAALKTVKASISGKATVGSKLTVKATTNVPAELTYQWYANGKTIKSATKSTYTVTAANIGKKITVKATATQGTVKKSATSAATKAVGKSVTTMTVSSAKTVKLSGTVAVKVTVKSPGRSSVGATIRVQVGSKAVARKIAKPGTYTLSVKASNVGKGKKTVKTSLTLSATSKKYSATPSSKTLTVTVK